MLSVIVSGYKPVGNPVMGLSPHYCVDCCHEYKVMVRLQSLGPSVVLGLGAQGTLQGDITTTQSNATGVENSSDCFVSDSLTAFDALDSDIVEAIPVTIRADFSELQLYIVVQRQDTIKCSVKKKKREVPVCIKVSIT